MRKQLMKGNEAIVKSAILAGCRAFYGYPITPASEITEAAALYLPQVGGTFLQAESEVASINMLYGAASAGVRVKASATWRARNCPASLRTSCAAGRAWATSAASRATITRW
jgi:pyruvate/2-oxoacid:ferredoxin oxidoreductase alpha subunit